MALADAVPLARQPGAREAVRAQLEAAEARREAARQALASQKIAETSSVASAQEDSRRRVDAALKERQKILADMKATRDRVHVELQASRRQGRLMGEVAERNLADTTRRLRDATIEAENWKAKAAEAEEHRRAAWERQEVNLQRYRQAQESRVKQAEEHAAERLDRGQRILDEATYAYEAIHMRHFEHIKTQERHAERAATLRIHGAELSQQRCLGQIDKAKSLSARWKQRADRDMKQVREEAEQRVAKARQELADAHRHGNDTLAMERVCQAQAKRLAAEQVETAELERREHQERLQVQLKIHAEHLEKSAVLPVEQLERAKEINEAFAARNAKLVKRAMEHAEREEQEAKQRAERAHVALANLQAKYAAEVEELERRCQAAERENDAKVKAAEARTLEVMKYCEERVAQHEEQCEKAYERSKHLASVNTAAMKDKVSTLSEFSEQRVALVKRQAADRAERARRQLEQLERHVEDVRKRCEQRVLVELETAREKVRLAKERCAANVERADARAGEAEAKRDEARREFEHVLMRCKGAAAEARRRGLMGIADVLEPEGPEHAALLQEQLRIDFEAMTSRPATVGADVTMIPEAIREDVGGTVAEVPGVDAEPKDDGVPPGTASTTAPAGPGLGAAGLGDSGALSLAAEGPASPSPGPGFEEAAR